MIELLAACLLDDEKSFIEFTVNKVIVEKKVAVSVKSGRDFT